VSTINTVAVSKIYVEVASALNTLEECTFYMLAVFTLTVSTLCVGVLSTISVFVVSATSMFTISTRYFFCDIYIKYFGAVCNKFVRRISSSTLAT
jgi:hypothetical protein